MIVENQSQLSIEFLNKDKEFFSTILKVKGKEEEEEMDLDEEIFIPNWDISILNLDQIHSLGELLKKRLRNKSLEKGERRRDGSVQEVGSHFWPKSGSVFPVFEKICQLMSKFEVFGE